MHFASDNTGPVHPKIMEAIADANDGKAMAYGNDETTSRAAGRVREVFEAPDAAVYFVPTGTAANSLILATLAQPWDKIFCSQAAHINCDERNGPEFFTGGAKLVPIGTNEDKVSAEALNAAATKRPHPDVHNAQRGPVSITQVTERGTLYSIEEIREICDVAHAFGLPVHMDGARFSNAAVALGLSAAEMTWKAGIDAVSFGGTKNGCMAVEAVVFFDPKHAWEFELRRKRSAHLFSKHRYLSVQMDAYLTDGLWRETAEMANAQTSRLKEGLQGIDGVNLPFDPKANMIYFEATQALHRKAMDAGAVYAIEFGNQDSPDPKEIWTGRLVCDWSVADDQVDRFLDILSS